MQKMVELRNRAEAKMIDPREMRCSFQGGKEKALQNVHGMGMGYQKMRGLAKSSNDEANNDG
jgi:hypothetical protein